MSFTVCAVLNRNITRCYTHYTFVCWQNWRLHTRNFVVTNAW